MNKEEYFISTFHSKYIGDDGAIVKKFVYSKDIFFENVHFKCCWLSMYQIGYKAMIVNISDAVAMNAIPRYALLGVAMPKSMTLSQMDELSRGIREAASQYGIEIIGGDTISNSKLDISITVVSESGAKPLKRKGSKIGDYIAYTGKIGDSAKQLRYLVSGGSVSSKSRFVFPILRQAFVRKASRYLHSGMDLSDGLSSDIEKLTKANRSGVRFNQAIDKRVACSGEEYEMLISFSPRQRRSLSRIAAITRTPLTLIGRVKRGKFTNRCKRHHF